MSQRNRLLLLLPAGIAIALASLSGGAPAQPEYFSSWITRYPGSFSGSNASCQLCHSSVAGGDPWNGYGWDLRTEILSGSTIDQALAAVEVLDSDQDPGGFSNLDEINAGSQPGWTEGANNTIFNGNGTTQANQFAPASIPDLDPSAGCGGAATGNYCSSAPFSTGNSSITISPAEVSISANPTLTATATNLPSQPGIFIAGPTQASLPFFNGTLCISPTGLQRFSTVNFPSGGMVSQTFTIANAAPGGLNVVADTTFNFQRWNRDPAGGGGNANFSNGFAVCFTP